MTPTLFMPAPAPPPPPSGEWEFGNVPEGLSLVTDNDHSVLAPSGWQVVDRSTQSPAVQSGETPVGDSFVRQFWSGCVDGGSPHYLEASFAATTEMYMGTIMRLSPEWLWANAYSGCKWFTIYLNAPGGGAFGWYGLGQSDENVFNRIALQWTDQLAGRPFGGDTGSGGTWYSGSGYDENGLYTHYNPNPARATNGEWFKLELHMNLETGLVRGWLNGIETNNSKTDGYNFSFPSGTTVSSIQMGSTMGGGYGVSVMPANHHADYARTVIYRKAA